MILFIFITFSAVLLRQAYSTPDQSPSANQLVNYAAIHSNDTYSFAQTAFGIVYPSLVASQAIGTRGPVLLQDVFLIEKLQSFNRERIPERVVHAKGTGAFGYFQVTNDISQYTRAKFLQPGTCTKVAVRFSTQVGELGSADTAVDTKGFAVKFYTPDGIHDLVGINHPVFFQRDAMLTTDITRTRKRNPQTNLHDTTAFWDLVSALPETTQFVLRAFSTVAFPKSYRYIDGFAIHAFKMVNAKGQPIYVKFSWTADCVNKQYYTLPESLAVAGTNPDALTQELFDSIANHDYPYWTLQIQVMTFEQAKKYPQNPFDTTKFWETKDFPFIPVGKLVLNRNPENHFADVEQMAFCPAHMVPGIEPGPDRLLHARMFAYADTQLYRLGTNHAQIPVNSCPFKVRTYQRDGFMNVGPNGGAAPNYWPNSFSKLKNNDDNYYKQSTSHECGDVDRIDLGDEDNFSQAQLYLKSYVNANERQVIVKNIAATFGTVEKRVQRNFLYKIAYKLTKEFGDSLKKELNL